MVVTVSGIVTVLRAVQPENAFPRIVVTPSGIVTERKAAALLNPPIPVTG